MEGTYGCQNMYQGYKVSVGRPGIVPDSHMPRMVSVFYIVHAQEIISTRGKVQDARVYRTLALIAWYRYRYRYWYYSILLYLVLVVPNDFTGTIPPICTIQPAL